MPDDIQKAQIMRDLRLPPLPGPPGANESTVELVLFRQFDTHVTLAEAVGLDAAVDYCNREDTHGEGWFTGWVL